MQMYFKDTKLDFARAKGTTAILDTFTILIFLYVFLFWGFLSSSLVSRSAVTKVIPQQLANRYQSRIHTPDLPC